MKPVHTLALVGLVVLLVAQACRQDRPTVTARDVDDAASVLLAVIACERAQDATCVSAAASAAKVVLPRLQPPPASSGGGS